MQRIGQQQKTIHQPVRFGCQNARLASTVGMSAQPYTSWLRFANLEHLRAEALSIARRVGWARRSMRTLLPERQIIAEDVGTGLAKRIRQRNQQWRVAIRAGAMSEDQRFQNGHKRKQATWLAARFPVSIGVVD